MPVSALQPWFRYAGTERFARNFRLEPYGLTSNGQAAAFMPVGYRLACGPGACAPVGLMTIPGINAADLLIEVEFAKLGGPDDAQYGVVLRAGANDALFFGLTGNGQFTVSTGQPGGPSAPLAQGTAPAFNTSGAPNTLVAVVAGGAAHYFINNVEVWQGPVSGGTAGNAALFTTSEALQVVARYARVFDAKP